jgi:hypothetical protein
LSLLAAPGLKRKHLVELRFLFYDRLLGTMADQHFRDRAAQPGVERLEAPLQREDAGLFRWRRNGNPFAPRALDVRRGVDYVKQQRPELPHLRRSLACPKECVESSFHFRDPQRRHRRPAHHSSHCQRDRRQHVRARSASNLNQTGDSSPGPPARRSRGPCPLRSAFAKAPADRRSLGGGWSAGASVAR